VPLVLVLGAVLNAILVAVVVPVLLPVVVWLLFSRYELLVVPVPHPHPHPEAPIHVQMRMRIRRPAAACVRHVYIKSFTASNALWQQHERHSTLLVFIVCSCPGASAGLVECDKRQQKGVQQRKGNWELLQRTGRQVEISQRQRSNKDTLTHSHLHKYLHTIFIMLKISQDLKAGEIRPTWYVGFLIRLGQ